MGVKGKPDIVDIIEKKRLQWYCHFKRMPEERITKSVTDWTRRVRRKRGRPRKTWMEGVQAAMTTRNLESDQWRNREEWRLVSGRRRQMLKKTPPDRLIENHVFECLRMVNTTETRSCIDKTNTIFVCVCVWQKHFWPSFMFLWPCIVSKAWGKRTNKMQQYRWFIVNSGCWLLTLSQHVSGIFMPIFRRKTLVTACGVYFLVVLDVAGCGTVVLCWGCDHCEGCCSTQGT